MKPYFLALCLVVIVGCSTTQQTSVYNTLSGIEITSRDAFNAYTTAVINKQIATNSVPQISQAYDTLHQAIVLAAVADQAGTNAISPANLVIETSQFITLITPYLPNK